MNFYISKVRFSYVKYKIYRGYVEQVMIWIFSLHKVKYICQKNIFYAQRRKAESKYVLKGYPLEAKTAPKN